MISIEQAIACDRNGKSGYAMKNMPDAKAAIRLANFVSNPYKRFRIQLKIFSKKIK